MNLSRSKKIRFLHWLLLAVLAFVWLGACAPAAGPAPSSPGQPAGSQAPTAPPPMEEATLGIALTSRVGIYWPYFVAEAKGFFERQKLKVEPTYTDSGVRSTQALAGGSVELAIPGPDAIITANEKGGNMVLVGGGVHKLTYSLLVQPEIKSPQDLKGKTFGVSGLKGGNSVVARRMLDHYGLKKEGEDFSLQVVGATPQAVAALKARAIDAALILQPQDFAVMEDGYPRLALSSDVIPKYAFIAVGARRDWAQQNKDKVARFLRGMIDAEQWLYNTQNKDEAVQILVQVSNIKEDYARKTYELYVEQAQIFPRNGEVDIEGLKAVMEALADQGDLQRPLPDPMKYIDNSYVEAARRIPTR